MPTSSLPPTAKNKSSSIILFNFDVRPLEAEFLVRVSQKKNRCGIFINFRLSSLIFQIKKSEIYYSNFEHGQMSLSGASLLQKNNLRRTMKYFDAAEKIHAGADANQKITYHRPK